jgi:hypothetical protein
MRRKMSKRPPFENRWTSGRRAWCWYQELEGLGVEEARLRLTLRDARQPVDLLDPAIPAGFIRDWLRYHDRRVHRGMLRWVAAAVFMAALALTAAIVASWPMISRVL